MSNLSGMRDWLIGQRLKRSSRPILIGPWRTELGFESLYWLPWLAKFRETYGIAKDRLIAVSRGGAGHWYDAGQALELYDHLPAAQIRQAMLADAQRTGSVKHQTMAPWERTLLQFVAESQGITKYHVLHPSQMYQDLSPWWEGTMGTQELFSRLKFAPIPVPHPPLNIPLPDKFIAVSFYARHTWPLSDDLKTWVANQVDYLAKHIPVVLLESGFHADDHLPFPLEGPNIVSLAPYVTPRDNLAIQSTVIAKSLGFVGTYGGTMQLAVRLGKPAVGFYQKFEGTCYAHKALTEQIAVQQQTPCFVGRPDDARYVREILP